MIDIYDYFSTISTFKFISFYIFYNYYLTNISIHKHCRNCFNLCLESLFCYRKVVVLVCILEKKNIDSLFFLSKCYHVSFIFRIHCFKTKVCLGEQNKLTIHNYKAASLFQSIIFYFMV